MIFLNLFIIVSIFVAVILLLFPVKENNVVKYFILFAMWLVFTFSSESFDLNNLEFRYLHQLDSYDLSIGFGVLMDFCYDLAIPFVLFKALIGIIILLLLYESISKITSRQNVVLALMLLYPYWGFCMQLRNGLSMAIVLYAIACLVTEGSRSSKKYIFLILFASLFHYSSLFYLLFVFICNTKFIQPKINYFIPFIIVSFVMTQMNLVFNLIGDVVSVWDPRFSLWLDYSRLSDESELNMTGRIFLIIAHIVRCVIILLCYECYKSRRHAESQKIISNTNPIRNNEELMWNSLIKFELFLLCVLPFYIVSGSAVRISQFTIIFVYCAIANIAKKSWDYKGTFKKFPAGIGWMFIRPGILIYSLFTLWVSEQSTEQLDGFLSSFSLKSIIF